MIDERDVKAKAWDEFYYATNQAAYAGRTQAFTSRNIAGDMARMEKQMREILVQEEIDEEKERKEQTEKAYMDYILRMTGWPCCNNPVA